jgi:hypothetical protein
VRVHELAGRFGLTAEALAHFRVPGEVLVQHLHHQRALEHRMQCVIHVRHAAAAQPAHDAIPPTGRLAHEADLGIGRLARRFLQLRQLPLAPEAFHRARAVPGSAGGAKHFQMGDVGCGMWEDPDI